MTIRRGTHQARRVVSSTWRRGVSQFAPGRSPQVCADVAAWAAAHQGAHGLEVLEPRRLARHLPRTVEPAVHDVYRKRQFADQARRYLVPIERARLVGSRALVLLPDGSIAAESAWGEPELSRDPDFVARRHRQAISKPGNWFSLVVHSSGTRNYYHWFHDVLTRLHGVHELLPPDTKFVVPACLRQFQQDSLRFLGIPDDRLVPYDGTQSWELETLFFAPKVSNVGSDRGEVDRWLSDQILAGADIVSRPRTRRVYISRRNATKRRLVNDGEVAELLVTSGFETVLTEELSLQAQVALFAEAEALVSTHGAGMTNMLFSAPGLKVVDMIEPSILEVAYIYWAMADELDHEYWYFVSEPLPRRGAQNDTFVPLEKLSATLEAMHLTR